MSSKTNFVLGGVGGLLLILLAVVIYVSVFSGRGFMQHEPFPATRYLEDPPLAHHGNQYSLSGTIIRQLDAREGLGRLVVVEERAEAKPIPLFIPAEIDHSLYVGQRYQFNVRVVENTIRVEDLRKL